MVNGVLKVVAHDEIGFVVPFGDFFDHGSAFDRRRTAINEDEVEGWVVEVRGIFANVAVNQGNLKSAVGTDELFDVLFPTGIGFDGKNVFNVGKQFAIQKGCCTEFT